MSQEQQPRRRERQFHGGYRKTSNTPPTQERVEKNDAYKANNPGTEIIYRQDGYVGEIVNHNGLRFTADSAEHLVDVVINHPEIRERCELDTPGAVTTMKFVGSNEELGNLGTCTEQQQIVNDQLVHGAKFSVYGIDNGDGTWSVWRIVDGTEKLPVDVSAELKLNQNRAMKNAERVARKKLKLKNKNIRCELDEEEGGYQEQLNAMPGSEALEPIQRIYLRFIDPAEPDINIPVEMIVDRHGKVVFGRDLNCYLHLKGFLMEPTTGSLKEAITQLRVFELDESNFRKDPKTGRAMLANDKVEIYYDPSDKGNANTILVAGPDGKDLIHEIGSAEQAAVIAFNALNLCSERHALTGSPVPDKLTKAYIGLKQMFMQNITDNAAYFPSAGVIGFGIRVKNVVENGRHLLVIQQVIYHERRHKQDDQIQKAKGRRITGPFMAGLGEHDGDVDAFCFTMLDKLELTEKLSPGDPLLEELSLEWFLNLKGPLALLAFGVPIRVMDNEWTYPMDESTEEHDIGEKLDALTLHTLKAWVKGECQKRFIPAMSQPAKNAIFRTVLREVCLAMVTISKIVVSIIKENRPGLLDMYQAYKLVAKRNYGDDVVSYFREGYTVRHKVPDNTSAS